MALDIHGMDTSLEGQSQWGTPQYLKKLKSTRTSTTQGEVTPENLQKYAAAYTGLPTGIESAALSGQWKQSVLDPAMEAGRRQFARDSAVRGVAPGAGNEAWKMQQLAGERGSDFMRLWLQNEQQKVQNRLGIAGQLTGMLGRGSTTTEESVQDNPADRRGQFGGFQMNQPSYGIGGGGSGVSGAATPWHRTSYEDANLDYYKRRNAGLVAESSLLR